MNDAASIFDLTGKTAFVTGASSGIGLHTAQLMARCGAAVALAARRTDRLEPAVAELRDQGHLACSIALDVTRHETIAAAWASAEDQLERPIDILFNNAGVLSSERFVSQDVSEFDRIFETNVRGAFVVAQHAAQRMSERRSGSIINVASTAGLRAGGHLSAYGSSKAALIHMTKVMALELAPRGVRVNALCPGNIQTDMHSMFQDKGFEEGLLKRIPMRRIGTSGELDGATLLLASDAGSYMTGAVVVVDGGQLLSWM